MAAEFKASSQTHPLEAQFKTLYNPQVRRQLTNMLAIYTMNSMGAKMRPKNYSSIATIENDNIVQSLTKGV